MDECWSSRGPARRSRASADGFVPRALPLPRGESVFARLARALRATLARPHDPSATAGLARTLRAVSARAGRAFVDAVFARVLDAMVARLPGASSAAVFTGAQRAALVLAISTSLAAVVAAQSGVRDDEARFPRDLEGEGAFDRGATVQLDTRAAEEFARGDALWAALAHPASSAELAPVFDAWRGALAESAPSVLVQAVATALEPDVDGSLERRSEGVERALERRLERLVDAERAAWSERFGALALEAFRAAGGNEERLERVARDHPRTRGALRAHLALCDLAFERGATLLARTRLERARSALDVASSDEAAAHARRSRLLDEAAPLARVAPRDAGLARAAGFGDVTTIELPLETSARWIVPGIAPLAGGGCVVQHDGILHVLRDGAAQGFDARTACEAERVAWPDAFGSERAPWPCEPAVESTRLAIVAGRANEGDGNALAVFELEGGAPRFAWARTHDAWAVAGERRDVAGELGAGRAEFQPGPRIVGDLVLVQVRLAPSVDGEEERAEALCVAFDLGTGALAWRRPLVASAPIEALGRDLAAGPLASAVAPPPLAIDGLAVFVATDLGVAARLAVADGRAAWLARGRRRAGDANGFDGGAALVTAPGELLWAPGDSERNVYAFEGAGGRFVRPPRRATALERVLAGGEERVLGWAAAGGRLALAEVALEDGGTVRSVPFPPARARARAAVASRDRCAAFAAGELRLADRSRDLLLLDARRLADSAALETAALAEVDGALVLAGARRVWFVSLR